MLKKINLSFYKSLLNSDFSLLNSGLVKHPNYISSVTKLNSTQSLKALNIEQLLRSCKQFIRILQFIKQNTGATLRISVSNKQYFFLLKSFLQTRSFTVPVQVTYLKSNTPNGTGMVCHLMLDVTETQRLTLKQTIDKNIFIIQKINSKLELTQTGVYKIQNDLFDFKKIVFIFVLMELIFGQTSEY